MKECVFTICAKNYLAQTLALRESFQKYNASVDFYIFLADLCDDKLKSEIPNLIPLDCTIVPKWEEMAFKYTVLEFSVSLKPFCTRYLLNQYDKIIYLDSDMYVTSSLGVIFEWLNKYDMVITPHYNHIAVDFNGAVSEDMLSFVGIYNMGFFAIKNSKTSNEIIKWWMKRLEDKCYVDRHTAQHVDQRWIDFLPAFLPNDILITHHHGCNAAIWNLHERELIFNNGSFLIKDLVTNDTKELLFFHFSGFDPFNQKIINRRHPKYNVEVYPSFSPLIKEYVNKIYFHNYDKYSKQKYAFNYFANNKQILPINRRICRTLLSNNIVIENPFSETGMLYRQFRKNHLISHEDNGLVKNDIKKNKNFKVLNFFLKMILFILGVDKYSRFLNALRHISRYEYQDFLFEDSNKE
jgi:hypothetical protein